MDKERKKWKKSNDRKSEALGMKHGTAAGRLRKALLFKYAKLAGADICYRCDSKIETTNEFSIDHKIDWLNHEDPPETFFDLDNVVFSHQRCNIICAGGHNKKMSPPGKAWCWKCKEHKDIECFAKDKTRWNGLNGMCKDCRKDVYHEKGT